MRHNANMMREALLRPRNKHNMTVAITVAINMEGSSKQRLKLGRFMAGVRHAKQLC